MTQKPAKDLIIAAKPAAQNLDLASDDTVQASLDASQVQGGGRSAPPL
jgi:hypothetical protein